MNIHPTPQRTPAEQALVDAFGDRFASLPGDATIARLRDDAVETLKAGLPTRRIEAWHYTDLRRLLARVPAFDPAAQAKALDPLIPGSLVLSVLNGRASAAPALEGVAIERLEPALVAGRGGAREPAADDTVLTLNTAFVSDGFILSVREGEDIGTPIELQNVHAGGQAHARFVVEAGKGSTATIVERQSGSGDALASSVSDVRVGDGANLTWLIVQEQPDTVSHLGQFRATLGRDARLTLFIMNAGGKLVRQEVRVDAGAPGARFDLRGVNLLAGDTHTDVTMMLDHSAPDTASRELIRNVATGRARGVFQGQIRVARDAQKTDAKMACNTLLLSDDAEFSVKPELEIFADDVACGHGATVTEIEASHLFYLMARGVPEKEARGLLVKAFLAEVIEELDDEALVEALETRLDAWFVEHG